MRLNWLATNTMPLPKHAARRDVNEAEIIEALTRAGASVVQLSSKGVPDLLVGIDGTNYLIEVKTPEGKLTTDQIEFFETWRGQRHVARTIEEALAIIGR